MVLHICHIKTGGFICKTNLVVSGPGPRGKCGLSAPLEGGEYLVPGKRVAPVRLLGAVPGPR